MPSEQFLLERQAQFLSAFANPLRIKIISILAEGTPLCAGDLANRVGVTASGLSQHMAKLRAVGLVSARKEAQFTIYRARSSLGKEFLTLLEQINERPDRFPKRQQ